MKTTKTKKTKKEEILGIIRVHPRGISNKDIGKITGDSRQIVSTYTKNLYKEGLIDRPRRCANIIASPYMGPREPARRLTTKEVLEAIAEHPEGITNFEIINYFNLEKNNQWMNKVGLAVRRLKNQVISVDIVAPSRTLKNSVTPTKLHKVNKEYKESI